MPPIYDLIRLAVDANGKVIVEISPFVIFALIGLALIVIGTRQRWRGWKPVSLNIELGGIGQVELRPNLEDAQVAHRIWVELVTRKAALQIDPERDVIVEIYDSWYTLFGRVRLLLGDIPSGLIRKEESTRKLIRIATETLNKGLRPHLTEWQARFRSWYTQRSDQLKNKTPQELQKEFPEYQKLIADLKSVNKHLIQYAAELQKLVHGLNS